MPAAPPSLMPPADRGHEPVLRAKPSRVPPPPSTSRSLPPMPAIEPILEKAADARSLRDWDGALEAYKKALFLVDAADTASQASLYAYVAEVKLAQDKLRAKEEELIALLRKSVKVEVDESALATVKIDMGDGGGPASAMADAGTPSPSNDAGRRGDAGR